MRPVFSRLFILILLITPSFFLPYRWGTVWASSQHIARSNPPGSTQPSSYTHLVRAGNMLFMSGQVANNEQGELVGKNDMRAQLKQVFENIKNLLASEGADFSNVVQVTIYTVSVDEFRKASDIREEYTGGSPPATTLVQIDRLASPDYLVELAVVAVLE